MSRTRLFLNRWRIEAALVALLLGTFPLAAREEPRPETVVEAACTPSEKWVLGPLASGIPIDTQSEFVKFLAGDRQPFAAFAEIVGLRELEPRGEVAAFTNYWLGRTLFAVGLYSEAAIFFDDLVSTPPKHEGLSIQMAAMACLQRVHELAPQVEYSTKAIANIPAFYEPWLVPKHDLPVLWEATVHYAMSAIKEGKADVVDDALVLLEGAGVYELFVQGLWATKQHETDVAALNFTKLLSGNKLPPSLARHQNELLLLLASALYAKEDYKGAAKQLELIDKKSNELVQAQALLSSAQLMFESVSKSLSTAAVLKSDTFRTTFAPEAFTTISMGLVEYCRYPEAQSNLNDFRSAYEASFRWLKRFNKETGSSELLYPQAVAFLEGGSVAVPARVASEWIRSPIFISHQAAINAVIEGARSVDRLAVGVRAARATATEELNEAVENLKEGKAQAAKNPDSKDSGIVGLAVLQVAAALAKVRLARLERSGPLWEQFLQRHRQNSSQETAKLGMAIEGHLRNITKRMLLDLDRAVENNELVEAELLNSAGQDMVVQSVSQPPDSRQLASSGGRPADEVAEVWEDELGVSEVKILNNCAKSEPRRQK